VEVHSRADRLIVDMIYEGGRFLKREFLGLPACPLGAIWDRHDMRYREILLA
jgi:hypothetical protein